jgi:hypothetical protein
MATPTLRLAKPRRRVLQDSDEAFAKRHFGEATIFGLYDTDGVSLDEARAIFRMVAQNTPRIFDYEERWASAVGEALWDLTTMSPAVPSSHCRNAASD